MMKPRSREHKQPLAADAPIREEMRGLCKTCAFASDLCTHMLKRFDRLGGLSECAGYEKLTSFRNQCDGCMQGAPICNGNHVDEDGHPFMGCERYKYENV